MAINQLNLTFVDYTTVINASVLNAFQNKINELVDAVNNTSSGGSDDDDPGSDTPPATPVVPTITLDTSTKMASLSATAGLTIKYSTDGTTPSTVYSSAIDVSEGATIKAISTNGNQTSDVPIINVVYIDTDNGGELKAWATIDGTIRYTENGSSPVSNSTAFPESVVPQAGKTYKLALYNGQTLKSEIATIEITN